MDSSITETHTLGEEDGIGIKEYSIVIQYHYFQTIHCGWALLLMESS
jgi:hypothetical protein